MRQCNRVIRDRLRRRLRPLLEHIPQALGPFIGLVEVDAIERRADAQAINIAIALFGVRVILRNRLFRGDFWFRRF